MDNIRWVLLVVGMGIIALVYVVTRYQLSRAHNSHAEPDHSRVTATGLEDPDVDILAQELAEMNALVSDAREPLINHPEDKEQLIILHVMTKTDQPFQGLNIVKALNSQSLQYGEMEIYHRLSDNKAVFSVASAVKPGVFEIGKMGQFSTPGLTLILQLPGPVEGTVAFDDLINTANHLAHDLGGQLEDGHHKLLSQQALMDIRQSILSAQEPIDLPPSSF